MFDDTATIAIDVSDAKRSAEFYQGALGFTLEGWWVPAAGRLEVEPPGDEATSWVELSAGPIRLRLVPVDATPAPAAAFTVRAEDVDVLHRRVESYLGRYGRVTVREDGRRGFDILDPDGHRWSLVQA